MSQKYSVSVFRTGTRYIFFYISMFAVSLIIGMIEKKISCGVFILWVSNEKNNRDIGQKPYWTSLFFFALNYKHWKSQSFVNVFYKKRCSWKWTHVKLPAANKCNCS